MTEHDCYVGIATCGHVRWWGSFELPRRHLERAVAQAIRDGLRVQPAVTDEIRLRFGASCEACDPNGAQTEMFP